MLKRFSGAFRAGALSPLACLPRARPFSLSPTTSKLLLRRLSKTKPLLSENRGISRSATNLLVILCLPDKGRWSGISFRNQTTITDKTAQGAATLSVKFRGLPDRSEVVRWSLVLMKIQISSKFGTVILVIVGYLYLNHSSRSEPSEERDNNSFRNSYYARNVRECTWTLPSPCTAFSQSLSVNSLRLDHTARNALAARNNEA